MEKENSVPVPDDSFCYRFDADEIFTMLVVRHTMTQETELESEDKETRILVTFSALEDDHPGEDGGVALTVQISTNATPEQYEFWDLGGQINDLLNAFFVDAQNRAEKAILVEMVPLSDVALSPITTEENKAMWRVLIPTQLIIRLAGDRDVSDCHPFDFRTKRISTDALWPSDEMLDADGHVLFALVENGDQIELWSVPDTQMLELAQ